MVNQIIHKLDDGINVIEYEKSCIYIIENVLESELCQQLMDVINTVPLKKVVHSPGNNVECNIAYITKMMKEIDELYYEFSTDTKKYEELLEKIKNPKKSVCTNKLNGIKLETIKNYNDKINEIMQKIANIMSNVNKLMDLNQNSGYMLRRIYGETRLHIDNISEIYDSNINFIKNNHKGEYKMIRSASIIFGLNDNFDGGIYNFPYYDISIRLKKGSVIIFPPYWTHEHQVSKVENNTYRYTLSTWACMQI